MSGEQQRYREMLGPSVLALGCELLGVQISRGHRHTLLRIYIDRTEGVTLEDCTRVSRQVSGILDVEDPIEGEYSLEVSSPGADRPLFIEEHFERFAGRMVNVRLAIPVSGRRRVTGLIVGVTDGEIVVEEEGTQWRLPVDRIGQARLVPDA